MVELRIPAIGGDLGEIQLVEWTVEDGDSVQSGQTVFTVESDKSVVEIEAEQDGVLRIVQPAGGVYPIGKVIGCIDPP